jgi:hypothetical protein
MSLWSSSDGVSEGQFQQVLDIELPALKRTLPITLSTFLQLSNILQVHAKALTLTRRLL